jgi:methyl-accepting chemotaxis protein
MFGKQSISIKYGLIFFSTLILISAAILVTVQYLKVGMLRNEAQAVASQVVSFRSWVAKSGMVWVDKLSDDFHDFLAETPDGEGKKFYGKNPALATRELSQIANQSSTHATFRVTSDEYRHPDNKPDEFESKAIEMIKQNKKTQFVENTSEGTYRYAQPIFVTKACLKCHGDPEDAPEAVIKKYGAQKAFGYKEGDVRGIISVKLPDITLKDMLPHFANPYTIVYILLAVIINFIFTTQLIKRLKNLTHKAEVIAHGELDTPLEFNSPKHSNDELDHVYNAVNLLRNSMKVVMKRLQ